ncbi:MAG: SusD/RagB family nutrient-binding outer membrane lipoprotein [Chitinophagaceae bacterium]
MKYFKIFFAVLFMFFVLAACNKKMEELQVNPNQPTQAPPNLVLQSVLTDLTGGLEGIEPWSNVARWNQYFCRNYQYYGDNQYGWQSGPFGGYTELKNVTKMEQEAIRAGASNVNPYEAIGKFVRAWYFYNMSSLMGDIPMTNALQGLDAKTPGYDNQKLVFQTVLNLLDSANNDFASLYVNGDKTLIGDYFYDNDLTKWQKLVNTFKLRVLIALSKQEGDADLNIKGKFADIMNNPTNYPIFESADDNFQFNYIFPTNPYPTSPNNYGFDALRYNMAQTYVQNLTNLQDARVFITCEPAWTIADSLGNPVDFRAYVGASTGESIANMYSKCIAGYYSLINRYRYYSGYTAEPFILVGYTEMCFNIAEAINRGWISGDAATWYYKGITESMNFYGLTAGQTSYTATLLHLGKPLGEYETHSFSFDLTAYMAQPSVAYAGSNTTGLNQILLQKYLAFFQNSGWEAYYNYRRTGVPAFATGTGIGNNGIIPKRWAYPTDEQNTNAANWQVALQAQGFSTDDINGVMWLIK